MILSFAQLFLLKPFCISDLYYYTTMDYEDDPDEADEGGECTDRDLEQGGHGDQLLARNESLCISLVKSRLICSIC